MSRQGDLDSSVVAYDRELVPWLFEPWAEMMVDLVAPEPSSRVVDLACGSGLIVRHLLNRLDESATVQGVDIDAAMLSYAAMTVDDPRVSWHESDAARLPFESHSVDRASCHQGLQFFPDRSAVLAETRRVLEPGGRLAVSTWGRLDDNPWPAALSVAAGRLINEKAGAAMSVVCDLGDPVELGNLLEAAGYEDIRVDVQTQAVTHRDARAAAAGQLSALPSGSAIDELSDNEQKHLVAVMCELLADHIDAAGRLSVPSTCNLASGFHPANPT